MGAAVSRAGWRVFAVGAIASAVVSVAFVASIELRPWGDRGVTVVDDIGEAVAALIAGGACAWAAWRSDGRLRRAWVLIGAAAFSWAAGEFVWSIYEVALNVAVPFPSLADVGFLAAIPLTVAGVLSFSTDARGTASSWRLWLDGIIVALSLTFIAWAAGLKTVAAGETGIDQVISLAYPVGDIVIMTMLILVLRRAVAQQQGRMLLLLGGLASLAVADSAFAYLTAGNNFTVVGNVLDAGWVVGFLMIALAAIWPSTRSDVTAERAPIDLWQIATPWLVIMAASVAGVLRVIQGVPMDAFLSVDVAVIAFLIMVTQILTHRDSLALLIKARTSEATLADVIANAPAAIVRIGNDMRIIDANRRFGELLQIANGRPEGAPVANYVPASEAEGLATLLGTLRSAGREVVQGDSEVHRLDGGSLWLHWSATAVSGPQGETDYFILMMEDTTARHEHEKAVASNLELFQRLNQVKSDFLHTVSHEFKTALTGIQGFSELMQGTDGLDPDEVRSFASDIHRDAERLDRLIDEMLSLDRAETGRAVLNLSLVDINGLIERQVEDLRPRIGRIAIDLALDHSITPVAGDAAKLAQACGELLRNAVKYSPDGGRIEVTSALDGDDVVFSVRDHGTGIRAEFDRRLFGKDDLYADSPIRKVVGTGLGLGIVREIADLHGGQLTVDRIEGGGSEFHFAIPALHPSRRLQAAVSL